MMIEKDPFSIEKENDATPLDSGEKN